MKIRKKVLALIMSAVIAVSFMPTFAFASDDASVSVTAAGSTEIGTYDGDKAYYTSVPAGTHTLKFSDFKAEDIRMICRYDMMSNDMTTDEDTCQTFTSLKVTNDELNSDENFEGNAAYSGVDFGDNTYGYLVYTYTDTYTFFFVSVDAAEESGETPQESVTFSTKYGSGTLCEEKYSYYDFMAGKAVEYPMYELKVPEGTSELALSLSKECLVYNYSGPSTSASDNNYLAGWVSDYTKGSKEVTVKVDSNSDGKPDYIQVQNPYNADYTGGELLFAIKLAYQEEQTETEKPETEKPEAKAVFKSAKLSKTSYTYNGKAKSPSVTVKNNKGKTLKKNTDYTVSYSKGRTKVGTYSVTVKGKGSYKFTKKLTFKVNPKGTSLKSVKANGFKIVKVSWKKQQTQTSGYQIRISGSSSMKNAKYVKVTKNKYTWKRVWHVSKGKKYVQIRTYKKVGSKTYYSSWSAKKTVKVK